MRSVDSTLLEQMFYVSVQREAHLRLKVIVNYMAKTSIAKNMLQCVR